MLEAGIICPNMNPYSSLVLLVHMKDDSCYMCINFWALNKITIKDNFLIPTIGKLLDELHGTKYISKLDL